jgi:hypothetical protein
MAKRPEPGKAELAAHWVRSAPHKLGSFATNLTDFALPLRPAELAAADRITNVVLPLGPYRNLTTMTAALFALHPEAVVLNHAAMRVFGTRFDPFDDLSPARWRAFKAGATRLLRHGRKSSYGGSVLYSHAFRGSLLALYRERFGDTLLKPGATTLFWKDSMRFQNRFKAGRPAMEDWLAANDQTVFIFPVRDPMDCARSNRATGHWHHLVPKGEAQFGPILRRVLEALRWFRHWERRNPARFWSFTEAEIDASFPARFAAFCRLAADPGWLADAPRAIAVVERSEHKPENRELCARLVADLFGDDPDMRVRLAVFLD